MTQFFLRNLQVSKEFNPMTTSGIAFIVAIIFASIAMCIQIFDIIKYQIQLILLIKNKKIRHQEMKRFIKIISTGILFSFILSTALRVYSYYN